MTFSSTVKDELCRIKQENSCCMRAELAAAIRVAGNPKLLKMGQVSMRFSTENPVFARKLYHDIKENYGIVPNIKAEKNNRLEKHMAYRLNLTDVGKNLLFDSGIIVGDSEILFEQFIKRKKCCIKAYLRGAFLAAGSISDPEKLYHMEIVCKEAMIAEELCEIMDHFSLGGKIVERKKFFILYLKEGEDIVDFLNIIGAHNALMELENVRILKGMRNNVNRIVNCETANLQKVVEASMRQVENIKLLQKKGVLDSLPQQIREVALLRLEFPEANLQELGEMLSNPIGKSGVNHRLRKIDEAAQKYR